MKSVFRIIWKNLKIIMRSKSSSLIFIVGPLLVIFLAGFAFNTTKMNTIQVGTHVPRQSNLTVDIINALEDNNIDIEQYSNSSACTRAIEEGRSSLCLIFSPDFTIEENKTNLIEIVVDNSELNLAYMVLSWVSEGVSSTSASLTADLTDVLLRKLDEVSDEVKVNKDLVMSLTTHSTQRKEKIQDSISMIDGIDYSFDMDNYDTDGIEEAKEDLQGEIEAVISHTESKLSELRTSIEELTNLTEEERQNILEDIDFIEGKIGNLESNTVSPAEDIGSMVASVEQGLREVQARITIADNTGEEVKGQLNEVIGLISKDLKLLSSLSESFDRISGSISGIEVANSENIAKPISTKITPISSGKKNIYYMFPSIILVVLMFVSLLLAATLVQAEKSSKAYIRNVMTPTSDSALIMATYLTTILVIILQTILIIAVSYLVFNFIVLPVIMKTFLLILLSSTVFILLGMLIGYILRSEETATITSIFAGSLFLFLSDIILPFQSMPESILKYVMFNPYVLSDSVIKKSLFFNISVEKLMPQIYTLLIYAVVLYILIYIVQRFFKKEHMGFRGRK